MGEQVIVAGFGGQGILTAGELLAYAGLVEGKEVSWLPAYGAEQRGGTARCTVVVSEKRVMSPVVPNPSGLVVMNRPSLEAFEKIVKPGGVLVMNSSIIDIKPTRTDIRIIEVPANHMAESLGSARMANLVALGAFVAATKCVKEESVVAALKKVFPKASDATNALNADAFRAGMEFGEKALAATAE